MFDTDNMPSWAETFGLGLAEAGEASAVFSENENYVYAPPIGENDPAFDVGFTRAGYIYNDGGLLMEVFTLDGTRLYKNHWRLPMMAMEDGIDPRTGQHSGHHGGVGEPETRLNLDPTQGHVFKFSKPTEGPRTATFTVECSGQDINDKPLSTGPRIVPKHMIIDGVPGHWLPTPAVVGHGSGDE